MTFYYIIVGQSIRRVENPKEVGWCVRVPIKREFLRRQFKVVKGDSYSLRADLSIKYRNFGVRTICAESWEAAEETIKGWIRPRKRRGAK